MSKIDLTNPNYFVDKNKQFKENNKYKKTFYPEYRKKEPYLFRISIEYKIYYTLNRDYEKISEYPYANVLSFYPSTHYSMYLYNDDTAPKSIKAYNQYYDNKYDLEKFLKDNNYEEL